MKLLIKNGTVLQKDAEPCVKDIYIEDGVITNIDKNIKEEMFEIIDAAGKYILPGFIDMFCNIYEPGYEYREDISSASKAAAKGGFTSITCQPNTNPVIDNKTVVDYVINKSSRNSKVNIFPYGSMTAGCKGETMAEIGEMKKAGVVGISDGGFCVQDSFLMKNIIMYSSMFDIPVITMCNDTNLSKNGVMNRGHMSTKIGLQGISREAEEVMLCRNLILAFYNDCHIHITHVSTEGSVSIIRDAKQRGVKVTCETCPHYFTLSEELVESYNTLTKIMPPLRTEKDIECIKKGLVDGTIDVISSGHTPSTIESKKVEFDRATFGISSLETAFYMSYNALVKEKILTLQQLVEKFSSAPAKVLGFVNKGNISIGMDADIVIFDPEPNHVINSANFATKAKYSPYDGAEVFGEIVYTIVNGDIVYINTNSH